MGQRTDQVDRTKRRCEVRWDRGQRAEDGFTAEAQRSRGEGKVFLTPVAADGTDGASQARLDIDAPHGLFASRIEVPRMGRKSYAEKG